MARSSPSSPSPLPRSLFPKSLTVNPATAQESAGALEVDWTHGFLKKIGMESHYGKFVKVHMNTFSIVSSTMNS